MSEVDELLHIAGTAESDAIARRWLEDALAAAATYQRATASRRPASVHNAYLSKIEKAAKGLLEDLKRLREYPHAHAGFWHHRGFGPIRVEPERAGVLRMLDEVQAAAIRAKIDQKGRPNERGKQNIVNLAHGFFVRFSHYNPSADEKNPFVRFAEQFYEAATGTKPESLRYQIENALRRPIRAKAHRLQKSHPA